MTAKEYLQKGRRLNFEIDELIQARDNAFNSACCTAADYDGEKVQTSNGNNTENKFIKYADYSAEIDRRIDELYKYRQSMVKLINKLDNTVYRALLIARYINCKTWEQIGEQLNLSIKWISGSLHEKALSELDKYFLK